MGQQDRTSGPWVAEINQYGVGYVARICEESGPTASRTIAEVNFRDGQGFSNARLIAAAPDLLTACKALLDSLGREDGEPSASRIDAATDVAIAAIAKAQGQNTQP